MMLFWHLSFPHLQLLLYLLLRIPPRHMLIGMGTPFSRANVLESFFHVKLLLSFYIVIFQLFNA